MQKIRSWSTTIQRLHLHIKDPISDNIVCVVLCVKKKLLVSASGLSRIHIHCVTNLEKVDLEPEPEYEL